MTTFGRNMKLTIARAHRDGVRKALVDVLGATHQKPTDDLELFLLGDGFNIGVYFVAEGGMSADTARDAGVWLELLVDDLEATHAGLVEAGVETFDYAVDPKHRYYVLPGGPVFRLATS